MNTKNYREDYKLDLDTASLMKTFALLLVVIGHILKCFTSEQYVEGEAPISSMATLGMRFIYGFHMPLFVFASAVIYESLYQYCGKYRNYTIDIVNKVKRLLIPYFFVGCVCIVPFIYFVHPERGYKSALMELLLFKEPMNLWFLAMLFEIFLIVFTLRKFIKNTNFSLIALIFLSAILKLLAPVIYKIFQSSLFLGYFELGHLSSLLIYFVIGCLFVRYRKKVVDYITKFLYPLTASFVTVLGITNISSGFLNEITLSMGGVIFMYFTSEVCLKKGFAENSIIKLLNKYSFSIYLFHEIIIHLVVMNTSYYGIPLIILTFIISIVIPIIISKFMRMIQLPMLIGEK